MPVGTNATVKALDPDDLVEVGAQIILANTYHLYLRPGHERIARLGGLHAFMAWPRPILTDSGGFQVVSLAGLREIDDGGATFRSHLDGSHASLHARAVDRRAGGAGPGHRGGLRPARAAARLVALGGGRGDGADPPLGRALAGGAHAARPGALRHHPGRPGGGPARRVDRGHRGPAVRRPVHRRPGRATRRRPSGRAALDVVVPLLARDPRPRYLMGLGSPLDMLDAVHQGVDLFDSVLPARVARNGTLWVPDGHLNLRNARFLDDGAPVQADCPLPSLSRLLARLSGPSLPGRRAARVPPRDLSQPDLHPRLHGPGTPRDPGRHVPELTGARWRRTPTRTTHPDPEPVTDKLARREGEVVVEPRHPDW